MISSDILETVKDFARKANFPEGFVYKVWPVGDSIRFFIYRDNMRAMSEKELIDISNKISHVMGFANKWARTYLEVRENVPRP